MPPVLADRNENGGHSRAAHLFIYHIGLRFVVLVQVVFEFKELAHKNLLKRYQNQDQLAILRQATLLDPRLRDFCYVEDPVARASIYNTACAAVKLHAVSLADNVARATSAPSEDAGSTAPPPAKRARGDNMVMNFITSRMKNRATESGPSAPATVDVAAVERELCSYAIEPITESLSDDPVQFWKLCGERWPLLAAVAAKLLSVPATSVPSERLFSTAGMVVDRLRCSMSTDMVQQIMFLNRFQ